MSDEPAAPRPRSVTVAGLQAVVGGLVGAAVMLAITSQLNSADMRKVIADALAKVNSSEFDVTVDDMVQVMRYVLMGVAVMCVLSVVFGIYVLRRHRASRVALTIVGALSALLALLGGPLGWAGSIYIAFALWMLWSKPSRDWFDPPVARPPGGWPSDGQPPYGQPPYGQPPYGEPPYGQPPYGQPPYGQPPYGQPPSGEPSPPPSGQPPYGEPPPPPPPAADRH
jgi:hypothetical protein